MDDNVIPFAHDGTHHAFDDGESWKTGSSSKEERQAVYLQWLLTPAAEREPASKTELAELLGVTIQTLGNYTRDPLFQKRYAREAARLRRVEKAEQVMDRLYDRAMHGDSESAANTAARIWLDHTLKPLETEELAPDMEDMSDDEVIARVANWLKAQAQ